MKKIKGLSVILFLVVNLFLSASVFADGPGIQLYHPVVDGAGAFTLYDSSILPRQDWRLGLMLNYGHAPLQINGLNASEGLLSLDSVFAFGLSEMFEMGFAISMAIKQEVGTAFAGQLTETGLHDFALVGKVKILSQENQGVGLAFMPRLFIPTGEDASFLGDEDGLYGGWFILDHYWDRLKLMCNLGMMFRPTENQFNNISLRHQFDFGLGATYNLRPDFILAKAEISGSTPWDDFFKNGLTTPVQFYAGIDVLLKQGIVLNLGGSAGITDAYGTPDWRTVFGLTYVPHDRYQTVQHFSDGDVVAIVHFPFNEAVLQIDSCEKLNSIFSQLQQDSKHYQIELEGHADGIGSDSTNQFLGEERALAVQDYLVHKGMASNRVLLKKAVIHQGNETPDQLEAMFDRKVIMRLLATNPQGNN